MARPSGYTNELGEKICERLATSELGLEEVLEEIRLTDGYAPDMSTVWRWEESNDEFCKKSARARTRQARLLHDRAQRYAREAMVGRVEKTIVTDKGTETHVTVSDNVERAKLLVQTTLKRAGQLDCRKYGERLVVAGDAENPLQLALSIAQARKRLTGGDGL